MSDLRIKCDEDTHYWRAGSPITGERCNCGHRGWKGSLSPLVAAVEALPVQTVEFRGDLGSLIEVEFINRVSVLNYIRNLASGKP